MNSSTTITAVEPLAGRWLRLTFGDGAVHELDVSPILNAGGVLSAIRDDDDVFRAVDVDVEFGTIVWPGDVDFDPGVLRGNQRPASGVVLPRRVVQRA